MYVISAARGLGDKGSMGCVIFIVQQPPLLMKIYLT